MYHLGSCQCQNVIFCTSWDELDYSAESLNCKTASGLMKEYEKHFGFYDFFILWWMIFSLTCRWRQSPGRGGGTRLERDLPTNLKQKNTALLPPKKILEFHVCYEHKLNYILYFCLRFTTAIFHENQTVFDSKATSSSAFSDAYIEFLKTKSFGSYLHFYKFWRQTRTKWLIKR